MLKSVANLPKLEEVVFKGGGEALQALLSNTVQMSSGSLAPAAPHIKSGTLKCLAVSAPSRWPDLPDVPTMEEAGYKGFVFPTDCCLLAPAKTPLEAIKWLETESLKAVNAPGMKDKLFQAGFLPTAERRRPLLGPRNQGNHHVPRRHRTGQDSEALRLALRLTPPAAIDPNETHDGG